MVLPTSPGSSWNRSLDAPSRLFGRRNDTDVELYEEDDEFVLSVEMPGFEPGDIEVNWYEHRLDISADRVDEDRNRQRTYHRAFRMPKEVDSNGISARYENGILEVTLPIIEGATQRGHSIEVEG